MGEVLRYIPFAPALTQAPLAEGTQGQAWDQYLATKEKAKGELGALEQRMAQTDPERPRSWPPTRRSWRTLPWTMRSGDW